MPQINVEGEGWYVAYATAHWIVRVPLLAFDVSDEDFDELVAAVREERLEKLGAIRLGKLVCDRVTLTVPEALELYRGSMLGIFSPASPEPPDLEEFARSVAGLPGGTKVQFDCVTLTDAPAAPDASCRASG